MATVVDLFNPTVSTEDKVKDTEVYSVHYKKAKNGNVYKSVIRFIPWYKDPSNNYTDKYVTYLVNPTNPTSGRYLDNQKENCPLSNMYFRLVNTKIAQFEQFAKNTIKSKRQFAALVQIVSDDNQPNLVGQIKVFKFGKTIMDKIKSELNPAMGTPINPFHPIQGRYFSLVVTEQSGFPNYDQSQFFSVQEGGYVKPSGMWYINPTTNSLDVVTEQTNQQYVMDYLQKHSPDLSKYDIQPWSEQDQKYASDVLAMCENYITSGGKLTQTPQVVAQQSFATLNNSPVQNPVFPGAVNTTPTFPGSVPAPTPAQTPQFAPGAPTPTPSSFPVGSPEPVPMPQFGAPTPQPMVQGVEIPTVAPKGAPTGTSVPSMGMNVDDILGEL